MLFRRHLVHALFLAPLLAFTTTTVASACQPLDWVNYDGFPSCVTVLGGQEAYAFEVLNGCPDELTLASSDCPSCVSPDPIPNGDRGEIAFGGPPDEGESVDIDWEGNTIGNRVEGGPVPVLEDDVELGAYAQVLGGIRIGRGAKIGAMSVVLQDVPPGATAVGIPAKIIPAK